MRNFFKLFSRTPRVTIALDERTAHWITQAPLFTLLDSTEEAASVAHSLDAISEGRLHIQGHMALLRDRMSQDLALWHELNAQLEVMSRTGDAPAAPLRAVDGPAPYVDTTEAPRGGSLQRPPAAAARGVRATLVMPGDPKPEPAKAVEARIRNSVPGARASRTYKLQEAGEALRAAVGS